MKKQFVAFWWFVGWSSISLGFHIDTSLPNIEIHLPFGFIRIGFSIVYDSKPLNYDQIKHRGVGLMERYL